MNILHIIPFVILSLLTPASYAQDLLDLSLEELMEVKVKVATQTEKSIREAPGIITVIDENEIKSLGSRTLLEILRSVPGLTFAQDVLGNVSIIMRGIWAQEGRVLLLIDGMEMNERSYGSLQLGNHFPADHVKRIEIIRGPGSAIYGGIAELGVINVITKTGEDLKGIEASSFYSHTEKEFSGSLTNFMIGQKKDNLEFSVKGMFTESNFSDQEYTDENGATAHLGNGNSNINNEHLNIKIGYSNFYFGYIKDEYKTKNIILWGDLENNPGSGDIRSPVPKEYLTDARQIGYEGDITEKLNLHAYYQNKVQFPFYQPDTTHEVELGNSWRRKIQRRVLGVKTLYHVTSSSDLLFGLEQSQDKSWVLNRLTHNGTPDTFGDGSRTNQIENTAMFAQYEMTSDLVNLTAGLRYDNPTVTDDVFVPRLGLTKIFGKSHVKALFAQAFRAPLIENISLNRNIHPEITTTTELEYGYQFRSNLTATLNIFSTQIKDAILYSYDTNTDTEHYTNYDQVHTRGIESEIRYIKSIHDLKFNFSTYQVVSAKADPYKSELESNALLGAPRYKYFLSDSISVTQSLKITPSLLYLTDTYAHKWDGDEFREQRLNEQLIGNIFMNYRDLFLKGFAAGFGVNNIFNSKIFYAQPYEREGDYKAGPYPGLTREYVVKLDYSKEF